MGTRLKGRALEWFYSKPEYIGMRSDDLLDELRGMFYHRPDKIALRRRFEERVWKKSETFHDYVHEKTIMANRIAIGDDEILGYIIDGIPDSNLRDLARVRGFMTKDEMLRAFSEITLRNRNHTTATDSSRLEEKKSGVRLKNGKYAQDNASAKAEERNASGKGERNIVKRCFNCGMKDHVSQVCPTKAQGQKCFECNKHGHIARNCPTKTNATMVNSCAIIRSERKQTKDVLMNNITVHATI